MTLPCCIFIYIICEMYLRCIDPRCLRFVLPVYCPTPERDVLRHSYHNRCVQWRLFNLYSQYSKTYFRFLLYICSPVASFPCHRNYNHYIITLTESYYYIIYYRTFFPSSPSPPILLTPVLPNNLPTSPTTHHATPPATTATTNTHPAVCTNDRGKTFIRYGSSTTSTTTGGTLSISCLSSE